MRNLLVLACLVAVAFSAVLKLDATNFDTEVGKDKAVFVKFFAPWCGHCKALAPVYEQLAEQFAKSNKVKVAEVDCTVSQDVCGRFGVQGYPTLKFFPKGEATTPLDYEGGRTIEDLGSYLEKNADAKRSGVKRSAVAALTKKDFAKKVLEETEKGSLVKFYAPWCGHCKHLAPEYEKVAAAFSREKTANIVEVNCDVEKDLCSEYGVQGFPTVKYFHMGGAPEDYNGERTADAIVTFINNKLGLSRTVEGQLKPEAGRVPDLDAIASGFLASENKPALIVEAKAKLDKLEGAAAKNGKYYIKVMEKALEKQDWVSKEKARLSEILAGGSLNEGKVDDFTIRSNILSAF